MTNIARFEALGIDVELDESFRFRDHGYVDFPPSYFRRVFREGEKFIEYEKEKDILGLCVPVSSVRGERKMRSFHICYIRHENPGYNLHVRGHEETHALFGLGKIDVLQERIFRDLGKRIDFSEISDNEVIADIGGMYATSIKGFLPFLNQRMHKKCFREACDIFDKA